MNKAESHLERLFLKQVSRIKKQLNYVSENSHYYKELFTNNNINLSDINSYSDFKKIPTVDKTVIQNNFKAFWCVPNTKIIDYSNTSGTEGKPVTIPLTANDLERLATNEYYSLKNADGGSDEIYQLTTTIDKRFMAGLAYTLGAHKLGAGIIRSGPGLPALQWQTIEELNPTTLIIVPSFLIKLIDFAFENGIDYKNSSITKAICIGEPIRNHDFSLNALGNRINDHWDIKLYSTYASSEMQTAFTECGIGNGGHLLPDLIWAEVLNDRNEVVDDGELGELTITTLGVEGFPLVRFKTGDICAMHFDTCKCGQNSPRLGPIIGRKHQMIKYKGTTCYPPALFDVLDRIPEILNYQITISKNELGEDDILIKYSSDTDIEKKLITQFRTYVKFTPGFQQLPNHTIISILNNPEGRKTQKIIDTRDKPGINH